MGVVMAEHFYRGLVALVVHETPEPLLQGALTPPKPSRSRRKRP